MDQRSWNIFGTIGVLLAIGLMEILNLDLSLKMSIAAVFLGYCASKYRGRSGGEGALIGGLVGLLLFGAILAYETRTEGVAAAQAVDREISALNASLPRMVRSDLRLDRVSFSEDEIHYFATYVDMTIDDIDIEVVQIENGEYIGRLPCRTPDGQPAFPNDLKYHFYYFDMNEAPVVDFTVSNTNC